MQCDFEPSGFPLPAITGDHRQFGGRLPGNLKNLEIYSYVACNLLANYRQPCDLTGNLYRMVARIRKKNGMRIFCMLGRFRTRHGVSVAYLEKRQDAKEQKK